VNELDARLAAALQAEAPPRHDPLFRIEVLARVERARFRRQLLLTVLGIRGLSAPDVVRAFSQTPGVRAVARLFGGWLAE
jgi:hypothetical protein